MEVADHAWVADLVGLLYGLQRLLRDEQILLQHPQLGRSLHQIPPQRLQLLLDLCVLGRLFSNIILLLLEIRLYFLYQALFHFLKLSDH